MYLKLKNSSFHHKLNFNSFYISKIQKISENIARITKFRRFQNLLHRFSKDIILDVLIKTLSSRTIEIYEHV